MKSELVYYDIYPKIVPLRRETVVPVSYTHLTLPTNREV